MQIAQMSSYPYGLSSPDPVDLLRRHGFAIRLSPHERKHTPEETAQLLGDVDVLLAGTEPLPGAVLARGLPRLRHVARVGVGLDGLDVGFCMHHGIAVTYTPDAPARSVVEEVFGLLFSLSRRLVEAHEGLRRGKWQRFTGILWKGKTFGVLGCGRIGKQVAELARAFGMEVLAHDVREDAAWAARHGVAYVGLDELLERSLAITVHLPYTRATEDLLSRERLARMRRGAYVLNTSRGEVLDESALHDLLVSGHLGGAALDVYREEPYRGPLALLPNVFLCCHQGSCSHDGRYAMEMQSAENAVAFARGEPILPERVVWLPGMAAAAVEIG
ncbi:MAG: phosphoglycerate dehydrogenase [Planctomycetes bacterium]|nr:phosphoglycerate dehydrogenase [Planctomycetota bacterium]